MTDVSLKEKRLKNIQDATSFIEPAKVPVGMEALMWPFSYEGGTYRDVMDDPEKIAAAYTKFLDDVPVDYFALSPGVSHCVRMHEILGSDDYIIAQDGTTLQHVQSAGNYISPDDYPKILADLYGFCSEEWMRKTFSVFENSREEAYGKLKEAAAAFRTHQKGNELILGDIYSKRQIVSVPTPDCIRFSSPLNVLFDTLRGMENTLTDLRRRPAVIDEICAMLLETRRPVQDPETIPFGIGQTVYHSECFLSPQQFDKYFFSPFKELCEPYMKNGYKFFLKGEGHFLNTVERYLELPKGSVVMMLDEDDPFAIHEKVGSWQTIATGITADLLRYGNKQQCFDYVKRCFDTFAPGGGFMFLQNKPLLCAGDVAPDVLIAVYELANDLASQ